MSSAYWRINPVAMIGAATALISVFLPWWGIYELIGTTTLLLGHWTLYSPPGSTALRRLGRPGPLSPANISQTFTISSVIILLLALVVAALALAGGLTLLRKYLIAGLTLSIAALIAYTIAISYVTSNYCLTPLCITGTIGRSTAFDGVTFTWGFETGFYIFIVAAAVLALSIFLNNSLARTTATRKTQIPVPANQPAK